MSHPWTAVSSILFAFTGVFMMFIILLQRGRGGGLAGAFGAMGGQSAFGTKAGDVFTRITIGVAIFWIVMAAATTFAMRYESGGRFTNEAATDVPAVDDPNKAGAKGDAGNNKNVDVFEDRSQGAKPPAAKVKEKTKPAGEPAKTPPGASATNRPTKSQAGPELKIDEGKKPAEPNRHAP